MDAYHDVAAFWRDLRYIMGLPIGTMLIHMSQAARINEERRKAAAEA